MASLNCSKLTLLVLAFIASACGGHEGTYQAVENANRINKSLIFNGGGMAGDETSSGCPRNSVVSNETCQCPANTTLVSDACVDQQTVRALACPMTIGFCR